MVLSIDIPCEEDHVRIEEMYWIDLAKTITGRELKRKVTKTSTLTSQPMMTMKVAMNIFKRYLMELLEQVSNSTMLAIVVFFYFGGSMKNIPNGLRVRKRNRQFSTLGISVQSILRVVD